MPIKVLGIATIIVLLVVAKLMLILRDWERQ